MQAMVLTIAIVLLLLGHIFKFLRWKQFIEVYERPNNRNLLRALSTGYLFNFFIPLRIGDFIRGIIAGRKMHNGYSFSYATILVDRFLDTLFIGLTFTVLSFCRVKPIVVADTTLFYMIVSFVLIVLLVITMRYSRIPKKTIQMVSSVFNTKLELNLLLFFWSFISSIKDITKKISKRKLFLNTIAMWSFYYGSYYLFATYLSQQGFKFTFYNMLITLFSKNNVITSVTKIFANSGSSMMNLALPISIFLLIPVVGMYIISFAPRNKVVNMITNDETERKYINLLPQLDPNARLDFLKTYFNGDQREYLQHYLEMNRDIHIIQDFSAGSNATTMLCIDNESTFFRKYAFGSDGEKLYEQVEWLHKHGENLPLANILRERKEKDFCCYDMEYNSNTAVLFQYIHSVPVDKGWKTLKNVLDDINTNLHSVHQRPSEKELLDQYIDSKILGNIKKIENAKEIKPLLEYDELIINGKSYKNLQYYKKYLSYENLQEIFKDDVYSDIHGDLTIENIVCQHSGEQEDTFYLIDPNTGNLHETPNLDYAKLLQSIHGGYEFLMKTKNIDIEKDRINFILTRSSVYDEIFIRYKNYLEEKFTKQQVKSIFYHEIVHWLRLMPYKIEKNGKRAVLFYAEMLIVLNDVISWYENDENVR